MKAEFAQEKLGELIYMLGEKNYNAVTSEFWQKHINEQQPFTDQQIKEFTEWASQLVTDANELAVTNLQDEIKSNVEKAMQILKEYKIPEVEICRFGIYRQYEVAGEKISVYPFDDYDESLEDALGDKFDEVWEELVDLLSFVDEDYIYDVLGYDEGGQNLLILTQSGFTTRTFTI
jgi:hypothetical protein